MTDDLQEMLLETFTAHEHLADPDRARAVAVDVLARPVRHRWPGYAAAATVVLVAGTALGVSLAGGEDASRTGPASTGGRTATPTPTRFLLSTSSLANNRAAALLESMRVLELISLPDGARRLDGRPAGYPKRATTIGPSDPALTTTRWWSVPIDASDLRAWLGTHVPTGMRADSGFGTTSGGDVTIHEMNLTVQTAPSLAQFRPLNVLLSWGEFDGRTILRADTFTAAYRPHPLVAVLDPSRIVAVQIDRVAPSAPGQTAAPVPSVRLTAATDSAAIARLVGIVNALPGSAYPPTVPMCPMIPSPPPSDTITFMLTGGRQLRLHLEPACFGQVEITVDDTRLKVTLDPGDLDAVVTQLIPGG